MRIGLPTALTLLFVGLKLTHLIDWEWLWVLSPLWISFALWCLFLILWVFFVIIAVALGNPKPRRNWR